MSEYTVVTNEPLAETIIERFNRMGGELTVEQDEKGEYRVNPSPTVFLVHRGDNTAEQIRPLLTFRNIHYHFKVVSLISGNL